MPRYALNDKVGTHEMPGMLARTHINLSLRGAPAHPEPVEGRGNLDEVEHTSARTAVATARRLPRYARNDKVGTHEMPGMLALICHCEEQSR